MDSKIAKIYYSPQCYWKGVSAIKKLADAAKVPEDVVKQWLFKQAVFQLRDTFLGLNLTWRRPTRSTKRTFFFYLMTSFLVEERFTNMH